MMNEVKQKFTFNMYSSYKAIKEESISIVRVPKYIYNISIGFITEVSYKINTNRLSVLEINNINRACASNTAYRIGMRCSSYLSSELSRSLYDSMACNVYCIRERISKMASVTCNSTVI